MLTTTVLTHSASSTGSGHSPHATSVAHYYAEADDYYYKEGHATEWAGKGAEALGLSGPVDQEQFRLMLLGKLPNGASIATTFDQDNAKRMGVDLTFSAPKSVSMQALIGGDTQVIAAHDMAVAKALEYAETLAVSRRKTKGKSAREVTGNLVIAKFRHDLSRLKDPQLHTHAIALNATQRSDGQWRALSNEALLKQTKLIGAVYRAELATELQRLGYGVRVLDNEGAFELDHISREQLEAFSQRSQVIEEALANQGKTRATASSLEKRVIALSTRKRKEDLDRDVLQQYWQEKSRDLKLSLTKPAPAALKPLTTDGVPTPLNPANDAVRFAVNHLTERQSVMSEHDLITTAVQHAVGRTTPDAVRAEIKQQIKTGYLIQEAPRYRMASESPHAVGRTDHGWVTELAKSKNMSRQLAKAYVADAIQKGTLVQTAPRFTTQTALTREKTILKMEREGRATVVPIMAAERVAEALATTDLNVGQRDAVSVMLTSSNRFAGVQGLAGTGKTHMLKAAVKLADEGGHRVIAVAAYGSQVKAVEEAGVKGYTLAAFLAMKENPVDAKTIVVLDEAGVVPTRQMEQVMKLVERQGARMVLAGDIQQTKAIEAGRPFAQLQAQGMQTAAMNEIQRQQNTELKRAVELAAKGDVPASLQNIRGITELKEMDQRHQRIVSDYMVLQEHERAGTLVVSGTNEARRNLNDGMRVALDLKGKGRDVATLHRIDLTQAQRRHAPSYKIGDVIQPERDYTRAQLERSQLYTVKDVLPHNQLLLQASDGQTRVVDPKKNTHLSLYRLEQTELAKGDWVRITRNNPSLDVANGDRMRVAEVQPDRVILRSAHPDPEKSREVEFTTAKPLHLEHAYATTVHSAQGLTSDRVMIDADTQSLTSARDVYYVAISRARHSAKIYTDAVASLPTAFGRENIKHAALDLANRKQRTHTTPPTTAEGASAPVQQAQPDVGKPQHINERPDYERIDQQRARQGQRAAAVYQSTIANPRLKAAAKTVARVRNLSGITVVQNQHVSEMLLPSDARHSLGQQQREREGAADHAMRRSGTGADRDAGTAAGGGIAGKPLMQTSEQAVQKGKPPVAGNQKQMPGAATPTPKSQSISSDKNRGKSLGPAGKNRPGRDFER